MEMNRSPHCVEPWSHLYVLIIEHMYIASSSRITLRWPVSTYVRHLRNITYISITDRLSTNSYHIK